MAEGSANPAIKQQITSKEADKSRIYSMEEYKKLFTFFITTIPPIYSKQDRKATPGTKIYKATACFSESLLYGMRQSDPEPF